MSEVHNTSVGGHSGILATYKRVKSVFYWPHMKDDIYRHIKACDNCQLNKDERVKLPGLLQPLPIPEEAWNSISMDFITGLPKSEGKEVIFVVVDRLTKYAHFMAMKHPYKASDVANLFLETVYKLHGLPANIVSDRDPTFTSKFWQELMARLGVKLSLSTAYHPQTDGQTERVNQCIENYLRCMLFNKPKQWVRWLSLAEYWYNTNFHSSLKTSPFKALYGYEPPQLPLGSPVRSTVEGVNEMMKERHEWISSLKEQLRRAQDRMKKYADLKRSERQFKVGEWVYLKLQPYRQITVQGRKNAKLSPKFYGPFEVISTMGSVAYELNLPPGSQIHNVFHVSQLKGRVGTGQEVISGLPLTYSQLNSHDKPEGILGRRVAKRNNEAVPQILVKWMNRDEEEASWEDYEDMRKRFPEFILRDKDNLEKGGVSGSSQLRLGAVGRIDLVNSEEGKRRGVGQPGQVLVQPDLSMDSGAHVAGNLSERFGQTEGESLTGGPIDGNVNEVDGVKANVGNKLDKSL